MSVTVRAGAIEYLAAHAIGRDVASRYRLGLVASPLPGDEQHRGRLAIPYLTRAGVKGIKFRCVLGHVCSEHHHAKYAQHEGQRQRLYNTAAYFSGRQTIGICEGEIDAIVATETVGVPTLGIPGAQQWAKHGPYWRLALKDFSTVVVFADGDEPGFGLAAQVATDVGWRARVIRCDPLSDVAGMVANGFAGKLRRLAGAE